MPRGRDRGQARPVCFAMTWIDEGSGVVRCRPQDDRLDEAHEARNQHVELMPARSLALRSAGGHQINNKVRLLLCSKKGMCPVSREIRSAPRLGSQGERKAVLQGTRRPYHHVPEKNAHLGLSITGDLPTAVACLR